MKITTKHLFKESKFVIILALVKTMFILLIVFSKYTSSNFNV